MLNKFVWVQRQYMYTLHVYDYVSLSQIKFYKLILITKILFQHKKSPCKKNAGYFYSQWNLGQHTETEISTLLYMYTVSFRSQTANGHHPPFRQPHLATWKLWPIMEGRHLQAFSVVYLWDTVSASKGFKTPPILSGIPKLGAVNSCPEFWELNPHVYFHALNIGQGTNEGVK